MVPLVEQRGAIPIGTIAYGINPWLIFVVSLVGSFIPAPFIYFLFNRIFDWIKTVKKLNRLASFIDRKIQKGSKQMEKYEEVGLIIFIGIPLPTTGLWTGSAISAFLGMDFKKSMVCVFIGGVISAAIVTALSVLAPKILGV
jgi:uncharacterized membrane protein